MLRFKDSWHSPVNVIVGKTMPSYEMLPQTFCPSDYKDKKEHFDIIYTGFEFAYINHCWYVIKM